MSKKNVILIMLSISSIAALAILGGILADIIMEKTDTDENKYEKIYEESEVGKKIDELCAIVEYRPYDKTHIDDLAREYYSENGISPKEEGFFASGDWMCTYYSVDKEYIGKYIETCADEYDNKEYEIYEIKDVSSEYAVAYKDATVDYYFGLINFFYLPESLQDYIKDLNITNSYVEIDLGYIGTLKNDDEKKMTRVTFAVEDDYLFNEFFKDRKYVGKIGRGMYSSEKITVMSIYLYQKELKLKIRLDVGLNGSISTDGMEISSLFSGNADATLKLLDYIAEHYEGYKEEEYIESDNLPILGDKNEFLGKWFLG